MTFGQQERQEKRKEIEKLPNFLKKEKTLNSVQDLSPDKHCLCLFLLDNAVSFIDGTLDHTWEVQNSDQVFTGTITKINKNFVWIQYIGVKKVTKLSIFALITDIILDDALFS